MASAHPRGSRRVNQCRPVPFGAPPSRGVHLAGSPADQRKLKVSLPEPRRCGPRWVVWVRTPYQLGHADHRASAAPHGWTVVCRRDSFDERAALWPRDGSVEGHGSTSHQTSPWTGCRHAFRSPGVVVHGGGKRPRRSRFTGRCQRRSVWQRSVTNSVVGRHVAVRAMKRDAARTGSTPPDFLTVEEAAAICASGAPPRSAWLTSTLPPAGPAGCCRSSGAASSSACPATSSRRFWAGRSRGRSFLGSRSARTGSPRSTHPSLLTAHRAPTHIADEADPRLYRFHASRLFDANLPASVEQLALLPN